jgi:hypothetical protein
MGHTPKYPFREEVLAKQSAIPLDFKTRGISTIKNNDGLCNTDQKQFVREVITFLSIIALVAVMFMVLLLCEPTPHKKGGGTYAGRNFEAERR